MYNYILLIVHHFLVCRFHEIAQAQANADTHTALTWDQLYAFSDWLTGEMAADSYTETEWEKFLVGSDCFLFFVF